jgi:hypothetical protein
LAGGVKTSRRLGSGLGFGLGAFFVSFLPLSLFPMARSLTQKRLGEKGGCFLRKAGGDYS